MVITDITEGKKNKNRVNIFADGEFLCALYLETALGGNISKGCEVSREMIDRLLEEDEKKYALDIALKFLSYRMRSVKETTDRLRKEKISQESIDYATERLSGLGYLDDMAFADTYAKELSANFGKIMIRQKLVAKGIDRETADQVLQNLGQDGLADEWAEKLKQRYAGDEPAKARQKAFRAMMTRGFSFDEIKSSLDRVFSGCGED